MVSATDSTMLSRPLQDVADPLEDQLSGLSRARLYLNLPRRKEAEAAGDNAQAAPAATRTGNRLRSISTSDASSLRSYPSLPSLEADTDSAADRDADAAPSHMLTSPTSTASSRTQPHIRNADAGVPLHLHPWEWEISREGFIPSPLPSPGLPDGPGAHPHVHGTQTPKLGSASSANNSSRTESFFTTSFKSLPTPPRPLASASTGSCPALADSARALAKAIGADGESLPPSPTLAVGTGASTLGAFGSRPRAPALDLPSLVMDGVGPSPRDQDGPASASALLNRARSLGEQTRATRNRQRGVTIQNARSSAFFSTSFVAYPPGMQAVDDVPTPAVQSPVVASASTMAPQYASLGARPGGSAPRLPSTLRDERNPSRSVTDPTASTSALGAISLDDDHRVLGSPLRFQHTERFAESPGVSTSQMRERLVRERSRQDDINEESPFRAMAHGRTRSFAEATGTRIKADDVLVPEPAEERGGPAVGMEDEPAWRVESVLGEGAFSTVWAGRQIRRGRPSANLEGSAGPPDNDQPESPVVAIKMMDKRICRENDRTRISFVREVQVLKVCDTRR